MARMTSTGKRSRRSRVPPQSSSRVLVSGERNSLIRYPLAPCRCTPSKPASTARRAAWRKPSMASWISSSVAASTRRPVMTLSTADGASGRVANDIDWLPAWAIWAKMRPPRRCTASVTRAKPGIEESWCRPACRSPYRPRRWLKMCPVKARPTPPRARFSCRATYSSPMRPAGSAIDSPVPARMNRLRSGTGPRVAGAKSVDRAGAVITRSRWRGPPGAARWPRGGSTAAARRR